MKTKTMDTLTWVLLFSGGLSAIIGFAMLGASPMAATFAFITAAVEISAGVVLLWLRSRSS
jgi:hypothetical protein